MQEAIRELSDQVDAVEQFRQRSLLPPYSD